MAKEHAEQFLAKMVADPELKDRIKAGYRRMLCDLARQEGLEVSAEDLQLALQEEKYRLADEDLAGVAGGRLINDFNFGGGGSVNTTAGGFSVF